MNCRYVFFDFDGTIADSSEGVIESIAYAYKAFNKPLPDYETIKCFFGPPLIASFMKYAGVDERTGEEMTEKYRELYTDNAMYRIKLYDGLERLLKNLSDDGIKIAIASSKPTMFFEKLLTYLNIKQYFDAVCGAESDEKSTSKTDIILSACNHLGVEDKNEVIMVGDRKYDILGAKGAGVKSIGVLYGYGERSELEEAGADFFAETTDEVYKIIKNL
ncbi:MAG: HAD-IA family hydrolase [Clostridia bacterium]|nr:HAD-IA family hydrolase [Clostridia bacterium]